ncbi:MAG: hypothetical protein HY903_00500 [Deltaproteobacteria bacterium]|nr:hypothetical protein [Deltaproteobacteria bacterium]
MLAENVLHEATEASALRADNVQNAIDAITVKLADVIVGTWSVANYGEPPDVAGTVTFNADTTYVVDGQFYVAFVAPWGGSATTYQVVANKLLILGSQSYNASEGIRNEAVPVVELKPTTITLHNGVFASVLTKQ